MFGPFNSIFEYFLRPKIYQIRKILSQNIFRLDNFVDPKFFWIQIFFDQNYFYPKFFPSQNFFCPKICLPIFLLSHFLWLKMFWPKFFGPQIFFGPKYFWLIFFNQNFFDPISFLTQKSFDPNYLSIQKFSYPNFILIKNVFDHFFFTYDLFDPKFLQSRFFLDQKTNFFGPELFFGQDFVLTKNYFVPKSSTVDNTYKFGDSTVAQTWFWTTFRSNHYFLVNSMIKFKKKIYPHKNSGVYTIMVTRTQNFQYRRDFDALKDWKEHKGSLKVKRAIYWTIWEHPGLFRTILNHKGLYRTGP